MSEVKFEEYRAMGPGEQDKHLNTRIDNARKSKIKAIENIKRFEALNENLNKQIELLLELKKLKLPPMFNRSYRIPTLTRGGMNPCST